MNIIYTADIHTPVGEITLGSLGGKLCLCDWKYRKMRSAVDQRIQKLLDAGFEAGETEVMQLAKEQLSEYFEGKRTEFTIPLLTAGTDFQQTVWKSLQEIPFGQTQTYLGLSKQLNNPKAIRAVASANGANALSIFIPCHRIIGSQGELIGYAGGLPAKKKLLELENPGFQNQLQLFAE